MCRARPIGELAIREDQPLGVAAVSAAAATSAAAEAHVVWEFEFLAGHLAEIGPLVVVQNRQGVLQGLGAGFAPCLGRGLTFLVRRVRIEAAALRTRLLDNVLDLGLLLSGNLELGDNVSERPRRQRLGIAIATP